MIREDELREAIAECEGERSPRANTCLKLMAFYYLLDRYTQEEDAPAMLASQYENLVDRYGDDAFSEAISGKPAAAVWPIMVELMMTLEVLQRPIYESVLRRLAEIK